LGVFLYKSMRPKVSFQSKLREVLPSSQPILPAPDTTSIIHFEGPLFFANASYLEDIITAKLAEKPSPEHIILSASGINYIDSSGAEALELVIEKVQAKGVFFSICAANPTVKTVLDQAHLIDKIGEERIYTSAEEALSKTQNISAYPVDVPTLTSTPLRAG